MKSSYKFIIIALIAVMLGGVYYYKNLSGHHVHTEDCGHEH